jgi:hypothetical protein
MGVCFAVMKKLTRVDVTLSALTVLGFAWLVWFVIDRHVPIFTPRFFWIAGLYLTYCTLSGLLRGLRLRKQVHPHRGGGYIGWTQDTIDLRQEGGRWQRLS